MGIVCVRRPRSGNALARGRRVAPTSVAVGWRASAHRPERGGHLIAEGHRGLFAKFVCWSHLPKSNSITGATPVADDATRTQRVRPTSFALISTQARSVNCLHAGADGLLRRAAPRRAAGRLMPRGDGAPQPIFLGLCPPQSHRPELAADSERATNFNYGLRAAGAFSARYEISHLQNYPICRRDPPMPGATSGWPLNRFIQVSGNLNERFLALLLGRSLLQRIRLCINLNESSRQVFRWEGSAARRNILMAVKCMGKGNGLGPGRRPRPARRISDDGTSAQ